MLVTRPRSSSGTNASGIELQNVSYLGSEVIRQAHVPILNVNYDFNACGPYHDWLFAESYFTATSRVADTGFLICNTKPITLFESDSNTGNFRGVAIWSQDSVVSLISETEAGWYCYIVKWNFYENGNIAPTFEFGSVKNACVCNVHHHVYWRFDFALDGQNKNQVQEYNNGSMWKNINKEIRRQKDSALNRKWRILNTSTNASYTLIPGSNDGKEDEAFGKGDVWVFHNNMNEIDDHEVGPMLIFSKPQLIANAADTEKEMRRTIAKNGKQSK